MPCGWGDCPSEVRAQVGRVMGGLPIPVAGVYLHGSLALGCFNPRRSDVDLLVAVPGAIGAPERKALARFLLRESLRPSSIEVSFVVAGEAWRHPAPYQFHYSEAWRERYTALLEDERWDGWTSGELVDADLAGHFTVAIRRGVALVGQPARELLAEPPWGDYLDSVISDVLDPEYGLSAECAHPVWAVLNACRTLAAVREGLVLSKAEGGRWALNGSFAEVAARALQAYESGEEGLPGVDLTAFTEAVREELDAAQIAATGPSAEE